MRLLALAEMKPEDMASNELKKLREKFTKEAINDHQMAQNEGTVRNTPFILPSDLVILAKKVIEYKFER